MLDRSVRRQTRLAAVLLRLVADNDDLLHTLGCHLTRDHRHVQRPVHRLAAGHGDRVVVEDLVSDVDAGGDRGTDRQQAGMEIGAVTQIGEDMICLGERRLADPRSAFATHLAERLGAAVHPGRHVVAADAGQGPAAVRNPGRRIVRAAGAEIGDALHRRMHRDLLAFLLLQERHPFRDIGMLHVLQQAAADHDRDLRRVQLAG